MKNQWYGDHRDVVKWGVLLQLAQEYNLRAILQVAFMTPDIAPVVIASELGTTPLDPRLTFHFRDLRRILDLSAKTGLKIRIFDGPFVASDRLQYTNSAIAELRSIVDRPLAVLLDPDTGLAAENSSSKHVTPAEVAVYWHSLQPGDWLVLYQHAARQPDWLSERLTVFRNSVAGAPVLTFRAQTGARDVVFFAARRNIPA